MKPKSFDQITKQMVDTLSKKMETDLYYGCPAHEAGLRRMLGSLGIKSAQKDSSIGSLIAGMALQVEALEKTLAAVTFDSSKLKLWGP